MIGMRSALASREDATAIWLCALVLCSLMKIDWRFAIPTRIRACWTGFAVPVCSGFGCLTRLIVPTTLAWFNSDSLANHLAAFRWLATVPPVSSDDSSSMEERWVVSSSSEEERWAVVVLEEELAACFFFLRLVAVDCPLLTTAFLRFE